MSSVKTYPLIGPISGKARLSLALGGLSVVVFFVDVSSVWRFSHGWLFGVGGVLLAVLAFRDMRRSLGYITGRGYAYGGLALAGIGCVGTLLVAPAVHYLQLAAQRAKIV